MGICKAHWISPLGGITMASDGRSLTGLWFDGQKYYGAGMNPEAVKDITEAAGIMAAGDGITVGDDIASGGITESAKLVSSGEIPVVGNLSEAERGCVGVFAETVRWLTQYFSGGKPGFLPPMNPGGSDFQKKVWKILLTIPYGEMMTYGQIAAQIAEQTGRKTMSAQAVGGAVGHNPISIIIPCHRVIGSSGSLTGYAGGIEKKLALLKLEGVDERTLSVPRKKVQGKLFRSAARRNA